MLCDFFSSWRLLEPEVVRKVGPNNPYEFALAQVMGCTISYQRYLKYFALEAIYAEDLVLKCASKTGREWIHSEEETISIAELSSTTNKRHPCMIVYEFTAYVSMPLRSLYFANYSSLNQLIS
uniref:Protein kinase domain-containing protein n=1 Tax=Angiostrongylus cantonensis TaxID=6313 RepID=A0A0K0D0K1_ANGCA